jgi:hypothetical protein
VIGRESSVWCFSLAWWFERTFFICIEELIGLLFVFTFVERIDWVVCLSLYDLVFFSRQLEFFLESEQQVFFQDFVFVISKTLKNQILELIEVFERDI